MNTVDAIRVSRCAGALGAEIAGVDLAAPLGESLIDALRRIWLEHGVIFFRDQNLSPAQFAATARRFGEPVEYPFVKGLPDHPEIIEVIKREHETVNFGGVWHSDTAYLERPPMATMLLARETPPYGGDTLFANQYLAWETLSEGMRGMLTRLRCLNSSDKADVSRTREDRVRENAAPLAKQRYAAAHPVARTHPETGRVSLYVNVAHALRFEGMSEEESAPILGYLFAHQVKPEFTCRFQWRPGSLALWDNRCTLHNPVNDYHGSRRAMLRITLAGDAPV
ncbi:MAG: TauD/TfdA family dioxygenase [Hyphomicrobiales bacterium]|nr:TauD/TfdA family dioxygenase [Hyphomicrobiales bacterium]